MEDCPETNLSYEEGVWGGGGGGGKKFWQGNLV